MDTGVGSSSSKSFFVMRLWNAVVKAMRMVITTVQPTRCSVKPSQIPESSFRCLHTTSWTVRFHSCPGGQRHRPHTHGQRKPELAGRFDEDTPSPHLWVLWHLQVAGQLLKGPWRSQPHPPSSTTLAMHTRQETNPKARNGLLSL